MDVAHRQLSRKVTQEERSVRIQQKLLSKCCPLFRRIDNCCPSVAMSSRPAENRQFRQARNLTTSVRQQKIFA